MLLLPEVAAIYRVPLHTMRKKCTAGAFFPPPYAEHPYRWRKVDIERDLTAKLRKTRRRPSRRSSR